MKISIVINCYNHAEFVGDAIASALTQTHPTVEVIVVDDGSTDTSRQVISGYGRRVRCVWKENGGQGSAYNAGFAVASGDIVVFLDSDDWLYPGAAEAIATAWQPGVSKVQFALDMVDRDGARLGRSLPRRMHDGDALALLQQFGTYGTPPGSGNAFAADFLRRVLPMDEATWRRAADSVPILLAPAHGRIVSLPQAQGAYRLHKTSDPQALTFNNAPKNLWSEYTRIDKAQRLVRSHLAALGQPCAEPMLFPPWEARMLALCLRFGGAQDDDASELPSTLWRRLLWSLWKWPDSGLAMRLAQSGWVMALWLLPGRLAHRVGRVDRDMKGSPDLA